MPDPNPGPHKDITRMLIKLNCNPPRFDVDAWDHEKAPCGHYVCNGGDGQKLLLNEILARIADSFPDPITLCIRDCKDIVRSTECGAAALAAPLAGSCVINVNNAYTDGSLEASCTFIYTTDVWKIEVVPGAKAVSAGSTLTFNPPVPGRVGAYRVDIVRKKPDGSEERDFACGVAEPGVPFGKEEVWFPPRINVNRASQAELELISGIGPATAEAIVDARQKARLKNIDDLKKVVTEKVGAKVAASLTDKVEFK